MMRHERISCTISVAVIVFFDSNIDIGCTPVWISMLCSSFRERIVVHLTIESESTH